MITHDYDYFDFIHTLLPTKLPLKDFYAEYYRLVAHGAAFGKQMAFMRKFAAREILPTIAKGFRFYDRLKKAYRDY
jgi:hypothetical protein